MTEQLKTDKKNVKNIFAEGAFYNIPDYQRPYVWEAEHINQLLDDLYSSFQTSKDREYFIGCMVLNQKTEVNQKTGEEITHLDILDGQQRFLTLLLLHAVIRDISTEQDVIANMDKRLYQQPNEVDGILERPRVIFDARNDDEFIRDFIVKSRGTLATEKLAEVMNRNHSSSSASNMANALKVMHSWFASLLENKQDTFQKELKSFVSYITQKVLTLHLTTTDDLDDAYNLFTVLNSRGVQLQSSDILKAQNLRCIDDDRLRKQYAQKWDEFIGTIGEPYASFDAFLQHFVHIHMKYTSDENKTLSKGFDFLHRKELMEKGRDTLDKIGRYVKHYQQIVDGEVSLIEGKSIFNNLIFILNKVHGSTYLAPLMHFKEYFGCERILEFLIRLENLISLSWLSNGRQLQTRLFIVMRKVEKLGVEYRKTRDLDLLEQVINCAELAYEYQDPAASVELNADYFYQMLDKDQWGSFSGTKINKTRYLLLKLDLIRGDKENQIHFDRNKCSVEHIMPRKPIKENAIMNEQEHQQWVHRLGNIVLLDRRKNASFGNASFTNKSQKYKEAIENRANTNYVFMTYKIWDKAALESNHQRAVQDLKSYYQQNSWAYWAGAQPQVQSAELAY